MLLKSIINSPDFDDLSKKMIIELAPETHERLKESADDDLKLKLVKIMAAV